MKAMVMIMIVADLLCISL
jgi:hypothetical protein